MCRIHVLYIHNIIIIINLIVQLVIQGNNEVDVNGIWLQRSVEEASEILLFYFFILLLTFSCML